MKGDSLMELSADPWRSVLFVNDGSRDHTGALLDELQSHRPESVEVVHLPRNVGKAEAVRVGLRRAFDSGADLAGYFDADLATPPAEMLRLFRLVEEGTGDFALASRVSLLGSQIERTPSRHYLGRLFASAASVALAMRVYDTQCGAKVLRGTPIVREALKAPFTTKWIFDVELMMRLLRGNSAGRLTASDFVEMPLACWEDVKGSKLSSRAMLGAAADLARLAVSHRFSSRGSLR